MKDYKLLVVFWEDHMHCTLSPIPANPDSILEHPQMSVGFVIGETDKSLILVSSIQKFEDRDTADYIAILKSTIIATKEFGTLPLEVRIEGGDS